MTSQKIISSAKQVAQPGLLYPLFSSPKIILHPHYPDLLPPTSKKELYLLLLQTYSSFLFFVLSSHNNCTSTSDGSNPSSKLALFPTAEKHEQFPLILRLSPIPMSISSSYCSLLPFIKAKYLERVVYFNVPGLYLLLLSSRP